MILAYPRPFQPPLLNAPWFATLACPACVFQSYVLYEVALYGIAGLLALSLALCAYVGYCFKRHRFTYVW